MNSSGTQTRTIPTWHECKGRDDQPCTYKGMTDAWYDPEIDRDSVAVWCPICGLDEEIRIG